MYFESQKWLSFLFSYGDIKILTDGVDVRLKDLLLEYAKKISVDVIEMDVLPDYIHLLIEVDPQLGIHKAIKSLKGYTENFAVNNADCHAKRKALITATNSASK